ncbi:hypothetical protein ACTPEM_25410, partial [Clostridioides difficile]
MQNSNADICPNFTSQSTSSTVVNLNKNNLSSKSLIISFFVLEHGKSWTHNLEYNMLKQVSSNIGLPLLVAECGVEGYEESFER